MERDRLIKDISKVWNLIGGNRARLALTAVSTGLGDAMLNISFSYALKSMVDYFIYKTPGSLSLAAVSLMIVIVFGGILLPVVIYQSNKCEALIMNQLRVRLFNHFQKMPIRYFEEHHTGDTLARVNKDINAVQTAITSLQEFVALFIRLAMSLPYILMLDTRLGLFMVAMGILTMYFNTKFRMPMRERSKAIHERNSELTEQMTENVTGFNVIKTYNLSDRFFNIYRNKMNDVLNAQIKFNRTEAFLYSSNALVGWLGYGGLGVIGAYFVLIGMMEAGSLVGSLSISGNITWGIVELGRMSATLQKAFAGSDRVYEILNQPAEPERYSTKGTGGNYGVAIKNGSFSYGKGNEVVNGLNIFVEKGKIAALVGYSGGGKSTIIKLLLGFYEMQEGEMTINGKGLNEYTLDELRNQVAYVPQDAYIFNGTIRENILYGNNEANEEDVINAAINANAHEFIMAQPDGYDTVVGERGIRLSGGQRQRIAIARAILKNAPILLLDEATSSLDSESEYLVQEALEKLMVGKTSIVVAHRLSTVEKADVIYFIKDGKVVEEGSHNELLKKNGYYSELYYREFAG
ncbi:MAG: ABC transporter ATP-binding protein [Firmicutes bacterium]|nr:ABC transporter ATP-binding protein [Bacillota bacterium]